jgi:DNA-binding XRE family transcriptional regulator
MSLRVTVKTRDVWIRISGVVPGSVLDVLHEEYGRRLIVRTEWDEPMTDVLNAPLYEQQPSEPGPMSLLKFYRQDKGLTQAELGRQLCISRQKVCDLEAGRLPISRIMALSLCHVFRIPAGTFLNSRAPAGWSRAVL